MQLKMVGIDHSKASIAQREQFSFTKDEAIFTMTDLVKRNDIYGCVVLSTCNRTELWVAGREGETPNPDRLLCETKDVMLEKCKKYFVSREDSEAIYHLLATTCGMNSKIFGEDQIITQIRSALTLSRDCNATDRLIEKVFQSSIAAGKRVKSKVRLTNYNPSVAQESINQIKAAFGDIKGLNCLVIGNGQMAALVAKSLVNEGVHVKMTHRKKYHIKDESDSLSLEGCTMIDYSNRYEHMYNADIVISATLSPHYTVELAGMQKVKVKSPAIWLDLAVPRDIDPLVVEAYNVKLFDIDTLGATLANNENQQKIKKAKEILLEYQETIEKWISFRKQIPEIRKTTQLTRVDMEKRIEEEIQQLPLEKEVKIDLTKSIEEAAGRAVNKLLCGLKETLPEEYWEQTFNSLKKSAEKETLKK